MNQLKQIWYAMSTVQRTSLVVVPVLLFAAIFGAMRWKHERDFRVLYSSLAPEDASALTQKMRESGIEYRLDETGSAISVPSGRIAEARLALAGAGLPHTGRIGFELFDRANLGASDFTEQVNYGRALEGELERTVATLSEIEQARIHITFAKESVFLDSRAPAKATVVLKLRREGVLRPSSVAAIANLVASAVDNLEPQSVAIIDSGGRLLNRPRPVGADDQAMADANLDYRHQIESDMLARINTALEPLVGAGRFRAGINVDCDFSSSEQSDEVFDGLKTAVVQSQSSEESLSQAGAGGQPGTASNLPAPPAKQASPGNGLMRRTENLTYQPTRTVRKSVTPKGAIRRISTAILVDQAVKWEGTGAKARKVLIPPSPEVLKGIRDVIAGITGYTEQRGDQITVETLPFEDTRTAERPMTPAAAPKPTGFDFRQPIFVYGGAVMLLLVLAVVFLLFKRPRRGPVSAEDTSQTPLAGSNAEAGAIAGGASGLAEDRRNQAEIDAEALSHIKLPANTKTTEVLVRHIRDSVQKDPAGAANILRTWVTEVEPKRTG
ncbi:MAG: flagellar M-ring protein FliF [Acidobacteriota bacterium]|nr:flagellar M-ring protein FliF [Acidobacteriota bacterium]